MREETSKTMKDPVCGMTITANPDNPHSVHEGQRYEFCCGGCKQKFDAEPEKYLKSRTADESHAAHHEPARHAAGGDGPAKSKARAAASGAKYTCPMDPEVVNDGPGSCPKCGMALEPMEVSEEEDDFSRAEYLDMRRRFWIAAALSLPVLLSAMAGDFVSHAFGGLITHQGAHHFGIRLEHAGGSLLRLAPLGARLELDPSFLLEHVHSHRIRRGGGLELQRGGHEHPLAFPGLLSGRGRDRRGLLRGGRSDHHFGPFGTSARTARAQQHRRRHPKSLGPRAQDRATHRFQRQRRGDSARPSRARRSFAGTSRRKDPDRRKRRGGA